MNGQIVEMDGSPHQKAQKLLPWLLTETLSGADLALVRKHLRSCAECREELAWQRRLQSNEPAPRAAPDVDRAFAALNERLDERRDERLDEQHHELHQQAVPATANKARPRRFLPVWLQQPGAGQWQRWAMALQCALIAGLALALLKPDAAAPGQYRALSAAPSTPSTQSSISAARAGNVLVMFKPDTTEAQLRRILNDHGARIVDGPTVTDAYVLLLERDPASALAALRREPAVVLAESLNAGTGAAR